MLLAGSKPFLDDAKGTPVLLTGQRAGPAASTVPGGHIRGGLSSGATEVVPNPSQAACSCCTGDLHWELPGAGPGFAGQPGRWRRSQGARRPQRISQANSREPGSAGQGQSRPEQPRPTQLRGVLGISWSGCFKGSWLAGFSPHRPAGTLPASSHLHRRGAIETYGECLNRKGRTYYIKDTWPKMTGCA